MAFASRDLNDLLLRPASMLDSAAVVSFNPVWALLARRARRVINDTGLAICVAASVALALAPKDLSARIAADLGSLLLLAFVLAWPGLNLPGTLRRCRWAADLFSAPIDPAHFFTAIRALFRATFIFVLTAQAAFVLAVIARIAVQDPIQGTVLVALVPFGYALLALILFHAMQKLFILVSASGRHAYIGVVGMLLPAIYFFRPRAMPVELSVVLSSIIISSFAIVSDRSAAGLSRTYAERVRQRSVER